MLLLVVVMKFRFRPPQVTTPPSRVVQELAEAETDAEAVIDAEGDRYALHTGRASGVHPTAITGRLADESQDCVLPSPPPTPRVESPPMPGAWFAELLTPVDSGTDDE
ncbi:hypothetical protein LTR74_007880 [Friedmanniomyces endolithicus]|nr:hypothetical protein LTR74_007880 [Friedmanniomyces endolithicus]